MKNDVLITVKDITNMIKHEHSNYRHIQNRTLKEKTLSTGQNSQVTK